MVDLILERSVSVQVDPESILIAADQTLKAQEIPPDHDLTVVITDDDRLQQLNKTYRGIDEPTDVLSFRSEALDPETGNRYLGDVVISWERAERQARAAGHSLKDELQLLVVHGILHLLGFDHTGPDDQREMWHAQAEILKAIGSVARPPA